MTPSLVDGIEPHVKFDIPHVHLAKLAIYCLERVVLHNIYITLLVLGLLFVWRKAACDLKKTPERRNRRKLQQLASLRL